MDKPSFARIVAEAVDALPESFRDRLDNVEIVVEDWPDPETMQVAGIRHPAQLLGFYHGVPLTRRGQGYTLILPDKITLYQRPIEMRCRTPEELHQTIHHVLRHEAAHYFGLDDDRLREIGAY